MGNNSHCHSFDHLDPDLNSHAEYGAGTKSFTSSHQRGGNGSGDRGTGEGGGGGGNNLAPSTLVSIESRLRKIPEKEETLKLKRRGRANSPENTRAANGTEAIPISEDVKRAMDFTVVSKTNVNLISQNPLHKRAQHDGDAHAKHHDHNSHVDFAKYQDTQHLKNLARTRRDPLSASLIRLR